MRENRLRWYGHVTRRNEEHITRTVMTVEQPKRHSGEMDENYFQGYKDIEFESRNGTCLECRNRTRGRVDGKRAPQMMDETHRSQWNTLFHYISE